jgi:hypothetical protein
MNTLSSIFWGAHAPRVLAMAPTPSQTFPEAKQSIVSARALKRAREARALRGLLRLRF